MFRRVATTTILLVLLGSNGAVFPVNAQQLTYDYHALAIQSVLGTAQESRGLTDVGERVRLLIRAAEMLPAGERANATSFLDLAINALDEWTSTKDLSWANRDSASRLRSEALALYFKLDPETASLRRKNRRSDDDPNSPTSKTTSVSLKDANWSKSLLDVQSTAEGFAKLAVSVIDTDPEKAAALVAQSVQIGAFAGSLTGLIERLEQEGNRKVLEQIEMAMIGPLRTTTTLDFFSLVYASNTLRTDVEISPSARSALIFFLMNSVERWEALIANGAGNGEINSSYIGSSFTSILLNVRPVIAQYAPAETARLDLLLSEVSPFVPEKTKARLDTFKPETIVEPRDRLNDILKESNAEKRDLRLIRFISQILHDENSLKYIELAAEAADSLTDPEAKTAFKDLLIITRVNGTFQKDDFLESQRLLGSISSPETRAWAMLALSAAAKNANRETRFRLISSALETLDNVSASPHKVELGLFAAAIFAKDDPLKAFEALSTAARYANSSPVKIDHPAKPPVAFGLDVSIGASHVKLGVFPEELAQLKIDPLVSALGAADWFRANQIADSIREPILRFRLKLELANAVIARGPRQATKETAQQP
jgi:hypothetical protein